MTSFLLGLQQLLRSDSNLPTLPIIVFQLHRVLDNELVTTREIVDLIERDPALAARTLRAANSAFLSRGGDRIGSIEAAVGRLGVNHIRSMCIVLAVVRAFTSRKEGLDHERFWEHSAAVGLVAERLARDLELDHTVVGSDVYVAGLLHDVGHLILDQFFPDEFQSVLQAVTEENQSSWRIEEERLGMDHGEIGGLLLGRWGLPQAAIDAVTRHHHAPPDGEASGRLVSLTHLVWAAEALCSATGLDLPQEGLAETPPAEVLRVLGIPAEAHAALLQEVGALGERARQVLN